MKLIAAEGKVLCKKVVLNQITAPSSKKEIPQLFKVIQTSSCGRARKGDEITAMMFTASESPKYKDIYVISVDDILMFEREE